MTMSKSTWGVWCTGPDAPEGVWLKADGRLGRWPYRSDAEQYAKLHGDKYPQNTYEPREVTNDDHDLPR